MNPDYVINIAYDCAKNGHERNYAMETLRAEYFREKKEFNVQEVNNLVAQAFTTFQRERREEQRQLSRDIGEGKVCEWIFLFFKSVYEIFYFSMSLYIFENIHSRILCFLFFLCDSFMESHCRKVS